MSHHNNMVLRIG